MQTSGLILDMYDDYKGDHLRSFFPTPNDIPEFVKSAHALTPPQRDQLPDDVFALVMQNGEEVLRKYACIDEGNTIMSVMYFLENAHKLPEEAQKLAAANLQVACGWYNIQVPEVLEKIAGVGSMALGALKAAPKAIGSGIKAGITAPLAMGGAAASTLGSAIASPFSAVRNVLNPVGYLKRDPLGAAMNAAMLPSIVKGTSESAKRNLARVGANESATQNIASGFSGLTGAHG
jgi:hypothetical protein